MDVVQLTRLIPNDTYSNVCACEREGVRCVASITVSYFLVDKVMDECDLEFWGGGVGFEQVLVNVVWFQSVCTWYDR